MDAPGAPRRVSRLFPALGHLTGGWGSEWGFQPSPSSSRPGAGPGLPPGTGCGAGWGVLIHACVMWANKVKPRPEKVLAFLLSHIKLQILYYF